MAAASYSFLEVAVLDDVRARFANGDTLVILSTDLDEVIWANGTGAALFGYPHVMAAIGAPSRLGAATRRQIASTAGFPAIGRDRSILMRMGTGLTSQPARLLASEITLPDGEAAILLAAPAAGGGQPGAAEIARRAIGSFGDAGHFAAFVGEDGNVEASSEGFDALGIDAASFRSLASGLAEGGLARDFIGGAGGELPAGMARLTGSRFLVVVIDEAAAGKLQQAAEACEGRTEGGRDGAIPAPLDESVQPEATSEEASTDAPVGEKAGAAAAHGGRHSGRNGDRTGESGVAGMTERASAAPQAAGFSASASPDSAAPAEPPAEADQGSGRAPVAAPGHHRTTPPIRFVWRTDAEGRFSQISREFSGVVGEAAADVVGRRFRDVAEALGLDPTGEIAGLLARRDTWSGHSVLWPVAGTDRRIPVDLAALPVYDRNRNFEGFRGFGVARAGDAVIARKAPGPAIAEGSSVRQEAPAPPPPGQEPPLRPQPERRVDPKVIRLAEHRPPASEKGLSSGERIAFQQIAERLKSGLDSGEPPGGHPAGRPPEAPAPDRRSDSRPEVPEARLRGPARPPSGIGAFRTGPTDAPTSGKAAGGEREPHRAGLAAHGDGGRTQAAQASAPGAGGTPAGSAGRPTTESGRHREDEEAAPVKPARWGLSLLDFARWDRGRKRARSPEEDAAEPAGAPVPGGDAPVPSPAGPAGSGTSPDRLRRPDEGKASSGSKATASQDAAGAGAHPGSQAGPASRHAAADPCETPVAARPQDESRPPTQAGAARGGGAAHRADGVPADVGAGGDPPAPVNRSGEAAAQAEASPSSAAEPRRTDTAVLDKLPVPLLVHSGGALHYANAEFLALTGYGSLPDLAAAGGIGALFAEPYDGKAAPSDQQLRLQPRDGQEFPVNAVLRSVPWNGGKALLLVLSRSREAGAPGGRPPLVAELEARVAEMRTIIDTATDGVVLISTDGTIRSISRPAEALFGFDSDEVAGKPFASLFAVESQRSARDYLQGLSDHGVASVLNDGREVIGREAQGRFIPLFMTIGKLPADSGYCAVVRDITQWKRAEEELTQARALAERASAHKTDFLARISHEIRTPLNAIIGFSELMIDEKFGPVANDRYRDYLRDINRSGNHVLDLVNDLLDISKIEAGQQEMANEAVSLNDTLAEAVALMQPQANRERVIIRSSFASKLPEVVADLRSVRQIALNILSNAVRYTQAGGQVIVSTAYEPSGEVAMRVRDTGIGMTQTEIEQALKPFKQISSLKRARGDGTGLGLPLTKAMAEANRARFSISSAPGEGTLVEISFPPTRVLAG